MNLIPDLFCITEADQIPCKKEYRNPAFRVNTKIHGGGVIFFLRTFLEYEKVSFTQFSLAFL